LSVRLRGRELRLHRDVRGSGRLQLLVPARIPARLPDGYHSRFQYGHNNGTYGILGNVLSVILNLQPLR